MFMFGGIYMLDILLAKDENKVEKAKRHDHRDYYEESDFYTRHPECNDEYLITDVNEIDPRVMALLNAGLKD